MYICGQRRNVRSFGCHPSGRGRSAPDGTTFRMVGIHLAPSRARTQSSGVRGITHRLIRAGPLFLRLATRKSRENNIDTVPS